MMASRHEGHLDGQRLAAIVAAGLVALAVAWGLRYGLLEAGRLPVDCTALDSWACRFKAALVWSFLGGKLGWLALACGGLAYLSRNAALAWIGWVAGLLGLILSCFDPSAVGALAALLVLIRPAQAGAQPQQQAA